MDTGLEIVVDGIIYQSQAQGGISRLFNEILPRMCDIDDSLNVILFTQGKLRQALPKHQRIIYCSVPCLECWLRPKRVWKPVVPTVRQLMRQICIGRGVGKIWHSTYYTMPERWDGYSIVTVHDMIFERFPDFYDRLSANRFREKKRCCIQEADAVICVSETTRQDVHHFYGLDSDSIYVVPHAYSDVFRQLGQGKGRLGMPTTQPFLLYVGARNRYKNFDAMIQAYSVWSRRKDVALVLVGGRPWSADEEQRLAELGIQDRTHILADVDDETLCQLYNQALGFVYPSLYEGFGIPLLEAMACGCSVIASRIPSTIEVAGECPIYFDATEVDDLVNAFDIALSEGRNSGRVQAGLERVRFYSWDRTAAQTLKVYRTVHA